MLGFFNFIGYSPFGIHLCQAVDTVSYEVWWSCDLFGREISFVRKCFICFPCLAFWNWLSEWTDLHVSWHCLVIFQFEFFFFLEVILFLLLMHFGRFIIVWDRERMNCLRLIDCCKIIKQLNKFLIKYLFIMCKYLSLICIKFYKRERECVCAGYWIKVNR